MTEEPEAVFAVQEENLKATPKSDPGRRLSYPATEGEDEDRSEDEKVPLRRKDVSGYSIRSSRDGVPRERKRPQVASSSRSEYRQSYLSRRGDAWLILFSAFLYGIALNTFCVIGLVSFGKAGRWPWFATLSLFLVIVPSCGLLVVGIVFCAHWGHKTGGHALPHVPRVGVFLCLIFLALGLVFNFALSYAHGFSLDQSSCSSTGSSSVTLPDLIFENFGHDACTIPVTWYVGVGFGMGGLILLLGGLALRRKNQ